MGKKTVRVVTTVALVTAAAFAAIPAFLARQLAKPNGQSLEQEKEWEKEHGLWNDFDDFRQEAYRVKGWKDYELNCLYVETAPGSRKYVIISHGYSSNRYGAVKYVDTYRDLGYNCILYDVRGHGENQKTAVSLGNFEAHDLLNLIEDCYERYGAEIELGLHGESMGSSISLCVLGYDAKVRFVVADCGCASLYDLIRAGYQKLHLGFLINPVNWMTRALYQFDMKESSGRDSLKGNTVPICLIHGADDTFIMPSNSEELKAATDGYSELHLVDGAAHAMSREVLGEEAYTKIVAAFLDHIEK